MYSYTRYMGECWVHTPYSWTSFWWDSFLSGNMSTHGLELLHGHIFPPREERVVQFSRTHIMTLASSLKSSSDMHSSRIIFTATFTFFHFASKTSPNWPEPNSRPSVSSARFISHSSVGVKANEGKLKGNEGNRSSWYRMETTVS